MTRQKTEKYSVKEKELSSCFLNPFFVILPVALVLFYNIAKAEDMTITTYYPSPNGTYDALSVKRLSVGDTNADGSINASDVPATSGYLLVSGRVGIGTNSPGSQLDSAVSSTNQWAGKFSSSNNVSQVYLGIEDRSGVAEDDFSIWSQGGKNYFAGNVGIGTTSPATKLHILGSSQNTLAVDSTSYPEITHRVSGTIKSYNAIVTSAGGYFTGSVVNDWIFRNEGGASIKFGIGTTTDMTISSAGNVGIGTISPSSPLEVYYALNGNGLWLTSPGYDTDTLNAGLRFHSTSNSGYQGDVVMYHRGASDPGLDIWGYPYNSTPSCCVLIAHFSNNGNVGIGTAAPTQKLDIAGGDMILHSDSSIGVLRVGGANTSSSGRLDIASRDGDVMFRMWTDSAIAQVNSAEGGSWTSASFDLAEKINYENEVSIEAGDIIVSTGKKEGAIYADKSSYPYQETIIGIVSTQPAFVGGVPWEENPSKSPVTDKALSLAGRVPAKVCTENGTIKVGDYLTSSSIPGVAMKATKPGQVVGKAMEEYKEKNPKKVGKITVFVNPVWFGADLEKTIKELQAEVSELKQEIKDLRNNRK